MRKGLQKIMKTFQMVDYISEIAQTFLCDPPSQLLIDKKEINNQYPKLWIRDQRLLRKFYLIHHHNY